MGALARSNLVVTGGTAASRITGLGRIVVFAAVVGQTALADAFDAANNSPNAIYELLIGGVLSASLVPAFTALLAVDGDPGRARRDTGAVFGVGLVAAAALTTLAVLAAPWVFRIYSLAPADGVDVEEFRRVGTLLARVFLVQIFFYALSALTAAALQARGRFAAAAWSPALGNLVAIALLLALLRAGTTPTLADLDADSSTFWILGASGTLAIVAMALVQVVALARAGALPRPRIDWHDPTVARLGRLSGWVLGYVAANQFALVAVKNLASPGSGLVDAYGKAYVIFVLPHGLLAVSIATTFVPLLARAAARRDDVEFASRFALGLRVTVLATLPAAVGGVLLAGPIVTVLLERGAFDATAVADTTRALAGLSVGLAGFSAYLFVLRGFYALGDTRTPFVLGLGQNVINVVLAVAFVGRFDVLGLGLAYSVSYLLAAIVSYAALNRRVRGLTTQVRTGVVSSVVGAAAMVAATTASHILVDGTARSDDVARLVLGGTSGLIAFAVVATIAGNPELRSVVARVRGA